MRYLKTTAAALAASAFIVLPAHAAGETNEHEFREFVRMADANKDGKVTKAEAMKAFEMMWDKHDAKKTGAMDGKAFQQFLMELMKSGA
jgi:hypothetical protein